VSVLTPGKALRNAYYGPIVQRAAAVLPATGNQTLFTVTGGKVMVTSLIGEFTVAGSATVTNLKLTAVGPNAQTTDICANALVTSVAVGTLFCPTTVGAAGQVGAAVTQNNEIVVNTGSIRATTDATNTGAVRWTLNYIPLDDGAAVTAA